MSTLSLLWIINIVLYIINAVIALTDGNWSATAGWGVACLPAFLCVVLYWE